MNYLPCCLLITSSVALILLVDLSTAQMDACGLQCMKDVFGCKRGQKSGTVSVDIDCCGLYEDCFLTCHPDLTKRPPCKRSKRGSWNKRMTSVFDRLDDAVQIRSSYQHPSNDNRKLYARDAFNFLFRPTADELE